MRFKLRFCLAIIIILTVGMVISYADETEQQNHNTSINETQFSTQANDEQTNNQVAEESNEVRSEPLTLAQTNQWIETSGQKFYVDADGNYVKGIYEVDNVIYYFDTESGALVKSAAWRIWNGKRYFTNSEGIAYRNQFISFGPYKFYMGADGAVMTGIYATIDGSMYYADDTGEVIRKAQWITQNGKRYFANAEGRLYRNQFISFGPHRYYMGADGSAQTGIYSTIDGSMYYADDTGEVVRKAQWIEKDGKRYFSNADGKLYKNQFISFGPRRYYMGTDGAAMTGRFTANDGKDYNADDKGELITNKAQWVVRDGKRYFINAEGHMYRDQFISFGPYRFYMGADGAAMTGVFKAKNGNMYYADNTGEIVRKAQWAEQNGKRYFCDNTGELYVNMLISFGPYRYYMGKDGAAMTGLFKAPNNHSYNADETGELIRKAQWIEQNGKRYFSNEDGEIYTNQFLYFGPTKYFVGPDGAVRDDINFDGIDFGIRQSPNYNIGRAEKPIDYIVIHHWGHEGQSFSGVVCWLCRMNGDSSAHYVVQGGRVECIVNPNDTAWHAGNWNYNLRTIGIECRPEMTDGDFDTTARLIANLWKMYGKKPIIGHRDIIPTACPGKYYTRFAELTQLAETYYNK